LVYQVYLNAKGLQMIRPFKVLRISKILLVSLLLSACVTQQSSFDQAQVSFSQGNYSRSFKELWAPVQMHDPRAMYAMGYMYYYGIGTNKDEDIGLSLIRAAAKQHCPAAVLALKLIQQSKFPQYAPLEGTDVYAPRGTTS
jgi:TPR repeat protein